MSKDGLRFLGDTDGSVDCTCNILNKRNSIFNYVQYMFDRTNRMFKYHNLPPTIPEPMLEYMLQIYGSVAVLEFEGNLYALRAEFGGPYDPYYRPTQAVLSNPALGLTGTYRIINHLPPFNRVTWDAMPPCVRFLNDSQIQGLLPLFARYATQLAENDVSIRSAQINLRQQTVIVADSGVEIESAKVYIDNLEAGVLSSIQKRPFIDGIQLMNAQSGQSNVVMQLIELQQYLKASWYNDIGLNSNFNMKSQYISSEEINSSADIMLPLIDNMYISRLQALEAINKEFGTNIEVEKDSAWQKKQRQSDLSVMEETDSSVDYNDTNEVINDEEIVEEGDAEDTSSEISDVQEDVSETHSSVDYTEPQEETEVPDDTAPEPTDDEITEEGSEEVADDIQPIEVTINIEGDVENIEVNAEEGDIDGDMPVDE